MIYVLDACALIAYLRDESGADVVEAFLLDDQATCYVHAVNLCEVYYDAIRQDGIVQADSILAEVADSTMNIYQTIEEPLLKQAGTLKTEHKLSLADCFGLALAIHLNGTFVTSDHHEFDAVQQAGICSIYFIR